MVVAYKCVGPTLLLLESGGGLHRHPIGLVWLAAIANLAEKDRTNKTTKAKLDLITSNADVILLNP